MKRAALLVMVVLSLVLVPAMQETAEAFHGHHGWGHFGHRHWGGWGGGWGGYRGWSGYGGWGVGYRSYYGGFGYRPFYSFYRPYYGIGIGVGYGGLGYGWGGYYGGYYPAYYYSNPGASYFYGQTPYYYNSFYGYPSCSYSAPAINYYATPVVNVTRIVVRKSDPPAPAVDPAPAPVAAPRATVVRSTIPDRSRARQQMKLGDAAFLAGRYSDALNRYRHAVDAAGDYAEAHYRRGHAYVAVGKYDLAAAAFRRALELDPAARRDGFRLNDIYGAESKAKMVHLENLAAAALMREEDANNYFLLGLMLRFDGESDRAEKFLAKAAALSATMRASIAALRSEPVERTVSLPLGDEI